ncbi:hypothetical protein ABIA15_006390 [Sinorhizobium fredii]
MTLVLLATAAAAAQTGPIIGDAFVVDGDTIEIAGERIQLSGVDAPEDCSSASTKPVQTISAERNRRWPWTHFCQHPAPHAANSRAATATVAMSAHASERTGKTSTGGWLNPATQ